MSDDDPRNAIFADVDVFQRDQAEWSVRNFGPKSDWLASRPLRGVVEEIGELQEAQDLTLAEAIIQQAALNNVWKALAKLCHYDLKGEQGIRYTPEQIADKKRDAVGDVMVYLVDYCTTSKLTLYECIAMAWGEVRLRDWLAHPTDADDYADGTKATQEIVYITGPISGIENRNEPAFRQARNLLRELGYDVRCPIEMSALEREKPRSHHLRRDIEIVMVADLLYALPGWEGSPGSRTEIQVACEIDTPVWRFAEAQPLCRGRRVTLDHVLGLGPLWLGDKEMV